MVHLKESEAIISNTMEIKSKKKHDDHVWYSEYKYIAKYALS